MWTWIRKRWRGVVGFAKVSEARESSDEASMRHSPPILTLVCGIAAALLLAPTIDRLIAAERPASKPAGATTRSTSQPSHPFAKDEPAPEDPRRAVRGRCGMPVCGPFQSFDARPSSRRDGRAAAAPACSGPRSRATVEGCPARRHQHRRALQPWEATANGACARRHHHRPAGTVGGLPRACSPTRHPPRHDRRMPN